jgi:hypothetical protein
MNAKVGSVEQTNYMFRSFKVPDDITDGSMIGVMNHLKMLYLLKFFI